MGLCHWDDKSGRAGAYAGKCVQIVVEPGELEVMLRELRPEGLMYMISARSQQEGEELLKMAEKARDRKSTINVK